MGDLHGDGADGVGDGVAARAGEGGEAHAEPRADREAGDVHRDGAEAELDVPRPERRAEAHAAEHRGHRRLDDDGPEEHGAEVGRRHRGRGARGRGCVRA